MKLSEAMMLGGTVHKLNSACWEGCLLGVSVQALGAKNRDNIEALRRWPWIENLVEAPGDLLGQWAHDMFQARIVISHLAFAVEDGNITLEQAVDWVRSVEPAEFTNLTNSKPVMGKGPARRKPTQPRRR